MALVSGRNTPRQYRITAGSVVERTQTYALPVVAGTENLSEYLREFFQAPDVARNKKLAVSGALRSFSRWAKRNNKTYPSILGIPAKDFEAYFATIKKRKTIWYHRTGLYEVFALLAQRDIIAQEDIPVSTAMVRKLPEFELPAIIQSFHEGRVARAVTAMHQRKGRFTQNDRDRTKFAISALKFFGTQAQRMGFVNVADMTHEDKMACFDALQSDDSKRSYRYVLRWLFDQLREKGDFKGENPFPMAWQDSERFTKKHQHILHLAYLSDIALGDERLRMEKTVREFLEQRKKSKTAAALDQFAYWVLNHTKVTSITNISEEHLVTFRTNILERHHTKKSADEYFFETLKLIEFIRERAAMKKCATLRFGNPAHGFRNWRKPKAAARALQSSTADFISAWQATREQDDILPTTGMCRTPASKDKPAIHFDTLPEGEAAQLAGMFMYFSQAKIPRDKLKPGYALFEHHMPRSGKISSGIILLAAQHGFFAIDPKKQDGIYRMTQALVMRLKDPDRRVVAWARNIKGRRRRLIHATRPDIVERFTPVRAKVARQG